MGRSKALGPGASDARGARRGDQRGSRITADAVRTEARTPQPKWRDVLPIHPAAEAFPRMSESDFRTLVKDVKEHGLKVPVVLLRSLKDGTALLLDGISRLDALEAIGVQLVRGRASSSRATSMIGRNARSPLSCLIPSATHLPSCAASMPTTRAETRDHWEEGEETATPDDLDIPPSLRLLHQRRRSPCGEQTAAPPARDGRARRPSRTLIAIS